MNTLVLYFGDYWKPHFRFTKNGMTLYPSSLRKLALVIVWGRP